MALGKTFTCMAEALAARAGSGNRRADNLSRTNRAAMSYIYENAPPELKAKFREGFENFFPDITPTMINENGERLYSVNDLAESLGMDKETANELARAMLGEDDNELSPLAGCH